MSRRSAWPCLAVALSAGMPALAQDAAASRPVLASASAPASASAASSTIPFKPAPAGDVTSIGTGWLAAVIVLCAVAVVLLQVLRKNGSIPMRGARGSRLIEVVETRRLGDRTQLSVVRYAGRTLLVAHGEHGAALLVQDTPQSAPEATP